MEVWPTVRARGCSRNTRNTAAASAMMLRARLKPLKMMVTFQAVCDTSSNATAPQRLAVQRRSRPTSRPQPSATAHSGDRYPMKPKTTASASSSTQNA